MKDSSSAAIGRMTSWNHFGTASLQNTLQGVSEPRARTRSATYIAPRARGTTPRATSPPPGGARQPPGHPTPPRTHSMTRATAARRKAGSKCRSTGSHRSSAGLSRLTLHSSGAAAGRAAAPHSAAASSNPRSAPRRISLAAAAGGHGRASRDPSHDGRLTPLRGGSGGRARRWRRGAQWLPPAGKAPHSPFPPAPSSRAHQERCYTLQESIRKNDRGSERRWKSQFQVPEFLMFK